MSDAGKPAMENAFAPLLVVDSLRVVMANSRTDIVDGVSFTLQAGEVLGLVGESGSGKTTVALAVMGYARRGLALDGGNVCLDGLEILTLNGRALRHLRGSRVAYVAQDPTSALNPALKVGTQLREIFAAHQARHSSAAVENRIRELLAEVRLTDVASVLRSYPHELSGGQQQRVMLAMAFACRPRLIVLDEPTTGLDVTTQRHVLDSVRGLCSIYQVAAIYVSHDLAVVGSIADMIAVMYAGRLVEFGSTVDVFAAPGHPYTRGLLRAIPSPTRTHVLEGMDGQPPRPESRHTGCFFAARCRFVIPRCHVEFPVRHDLTRGEARWARCHRAEEVSQLPALDDLPLREPAPTNETVEPLLTIESVTASYGENVILHDVSTTLRPHRCLAIVGESGAGKTTLARCIVGLHTRWTGTIRLAGKALAADRRRRSREEIQLVQYVFQNPYTSLNPRKTVGQLVAQPLAQLLQLSRAERGRRVITALRDAALNEEYLKRYPDQLSGGERQRVALARALVVEPKILVCDEVTSALDVSVQAAIVELLHRLKLGHDLAIVLITHNLALVRSLADDIVVLRNGAVVEQGPRVLDHAQSDYALQLLADAPSLVVG